MVHFDWLKNCSLGPIRDQRTILRAVPKMYHQTIVVILWSWSNNCSKIFKNGDLHKIYALSL